MTRVWQVCMLAGFWMGCRADMGKVPIDLSSSNVDLAGSDFAQGSAGDMAGLSYTTSTVAAMRQAAKPGKFSLTAVVIAKTPSTKAPKIFVQDAAGGDFSAMLAECSSGSTHPCSVTAAVAGTTVGNEVTITGTYIKSGAAKGSFEAFYIEGFTDGSAATVPTPTALAAADVARGASKPANWFQHVTFTITDAWKMYDWSPAEFIFTGATKCPYQTGFGMIPTSVTATATAACTDITSQPAGQLTPLATEILISTDFYSTFNASSDCRCAAKFSNKEPTATTTLTGAVSGILLYDVPVGSSTGHQMFAPLSTASAPLTNLQ